MGLAVPPEPQCARPANLDCEGRRQNRRPVRHDAGPAVDQRPGDRRIVGHGRDGRARATEKGARRNPVPYMGSPYRRVARNGLVDRLSPVVPQAAMARRGPCPVPREADFTASIHTDELAIGRQRSRVARGAPVGCVVALATRHECRRAACSRLRRAIHRPLGASGPEVQLRRAPRCAVPSMEIHCAPPHPLQRRRARSRRDALGDMQYFVTWTSREAVSLRSSIFSPIPTIDRRSRRC